MVDFLSSAKYSNIKYGSEEVQSVVSSDPVIPFLRESLMLPSLSVSRLPCWLLLPSPQAKCMFKMFRKTVINIQNMLS